MFHVNPEFAIPFSELCFTFVRSSGPGGQNVNKVASKAVLRWQPGNRLAPEVLARLAVAYPGLLSKNGTIIISSQRTRDAGKNRRDCLDKLRVVLLAVLETPKRRIPTRPTKGSVRRRLEDKAKRAQKKESRKKIDYP